jgi:hypothetical protein
MKRILAVLLVLIGFSLTATAQRQVSTRPGIQTNPTFRQIKKDEWRPLRRIRLRNQRLNRTKQIRLQTDSVAVKPG